MSRYWIYGIIIFCVLIAVIVVSVFYAHAMPQTVEIYLNAIWNYDFEAADKLSVSGLVFNNEVKEQYKNLGKKVKHIVKRTTYWDGGIIEIGLFVEYKKAKTIELIIYDSSIDKILRHDIGVKKEERI